MAEAPWLASLPRFVDAGLRSLQRVGLDVQTAESEMVSEHGGSAVARGLYTEFHRASLRLPDTSWAMATLSQTYRLQSLTS